MITLLLAGAMAGITCGLARLNIWAVISATALFLAIAVIDGSVTGSGLSRVVLTSFIGITLLQAFYLIGSALPQGQTLPASSPISLRPEHVRLMQFAIGQEMRMSWALPVDLPPQLETRVTQLQARYG